MHHRWITIGPLLHNLAHSFLTALLVNRRRSKGASLFITVTQQAANHLHLWPFTASVANYLGMCDAVASTFPEHFMPNGTGKKNERCVDPLTLCKNTKNTEYITVLERL